MSHPAAAADKRTYYMGEADMAALIELIVNENEIEWERFLAYTEKIEVEPGTVLIKQFDRDDRDIYILTEGELEISVASETDGEDITIAKVNPIAVLGEQSFLDEGARSATVSVRAPSTVHRLTFAAFADLCESAPDLGCAFLMDVAKSLSLRYRVHVD
jgi:CRP-like cAMP-binding protein